MKNNKTDATKVLKFFREAKEARQGGQNNLDMMSYGGTDNPPNDPNSNDPNTYMHHKTNVFGKETHKSISKEKYDRKAKKYDKQKNSKTLGNSSSIGEQHVSGRKSGNSVSRTNKFRNPYNL